MANLERLKTGGKSKMKIIDGSVTAAKVSEQRELP